MDNYGLNNNWKEVGKNPVWELDTLKSGDKFFGIYVDKEENVGPNSSNIYNFIRYDDQDFNRRVGEYSVWGTTLLDMRFKNFVKGERVAIVYLGKEKSEQRKGSSYHNFKVFHEPPKMQEVSNSEVVDEAMQYFDGEL